MYKIFWILRLNKMLSESSRVFSSLLAISRVFKVKRIEAVRVLSTAVNEEPNPEVHNSKDSERFRFKYPEFLPSPDPKIRNPVRELLERRDMLRRRNNIQIPEFYVGTILAVTSSNQHSPNKSTRFLGICIYKESRGLSSKFILRNVVEYQGVEVMYKLYSPLLQKIEIIKLEKRLDDQLFYLRDAPNEYSTFSFDMPAEFYNPAKPVPINTIQVPLNPRPWLQRYERMDLKGAILPELSEKIKMKAKKAEKPWEKYDMMDQYRKTVPEEEQDDIFSQVCDELKRLEVTQKKVKRVKVEQEIPKQRLF